MPLYINISISNNSDEGHIMNEPLSSIRQEKSRTHSYDNNKKYKQNYRAWNLLENDKIGR